MFNSHQRFIQCKTFFHKQFLGMKHLLKKRKKYFLQSSGWEKIFLASSLAIIIAVSYLVIAFLHVDAGNLALEELRDSWTGEIICHEDCALHRQEWENIIVQSLQQKYSSKNLKFVKDSSVAQHLKKYFFLSSSPSGFQGELVRIYSRAFGLTNPPDYLKDYLNQAQARPEVQAVILASFQPQALTDFSSGSASPLAYYFQVLTSNRDLGLKQTAIQALSSFSEQAKYFSRSQLTIIRNLILSPNTKSQLRQSLVLLLSNYYPLFSSETSTLLLKVYHQQFNQDPISPLFAADILNRQAHQHLILPVVSQGDWQKYYNN